MSEIIDRGSWVFAAVLVLIVSFAFQFSVNSKIAENYAVSRYDAAQFRPNFDNRSNGLTADDLAEAEYYANVDIEREVARRPFPLVGKYAAYLFSFDSYFFAPLVSLMIFYVPLTILLTALFGRRERFGAVWQRDYAPLAVCALTAYAAAHLPFAVAGFFLPAANVDPIIFPVFWFASGLIFGALMVFALRTVCGVEYAAAVAVVGFSWLGLSAGMYVFRIASPLLFSPFILFFAYLYFGGALTGGARGFGNVFRQRQNFKRFLHNATVNPRDADAHVQLGLIYLQRRQDAKASEHFTRAFEINQHEPDANYELGKLARQRGELAKAIEHFSVVVEQNDKYALSEIWREIGATYLEAGMLAEASDALEKFTTRRPVDAEGLYYFGKTLKARGETERAREVFEQAIESAQNSPDYRRRELQYWSKLARKEI